MSKASRAAAEALKNAPSLKYGDFEVTKDWKYARNPLMGLVGGSEIIAFNPNDPTQRFGLDDVDSQEAQQLQEYLNYGGGGVPYGELNKYFSDFETTGNASSGGLRNSVSKYFGDSLADIAEQKRIQELQQQVTSGQLSGDQAAQQANTGSAKADIQDVYGEAYADAQKNATVPASEKYGRVSSTQGGGRELTLGATTPISQEDYYLKPGESIEAYNARIASLRGGTTSQPSVSISQQDYQLRPGESVTDYNARIESLRSGGSGGTAIQSTGNPVLDETLASLQNYLVELEKRGQVVNPNIVLDEKTLAQFTKQAEQEINPYYASQLKLARESLLANAGYSRDEVLRNEQELERQYQTAFRQTGESAADRGLALSGIRQREEQDLATNTQNTINANRRQLEFQAGNQARQFAQAYGTSELPGVSIGAAPSITGGETKFASGTGTRSLYTLSPSVYDGLVGSQEFERRGAVRSRASQLEEAFRSNQGIQQQRSLTV